MSQGTRNPRYIVSPAYDWLWFLLPPVVALAAGMLISGTQFANAALGFGNTEATGAGFLIGALTHAHLVAVFFRSHGNRDIFRLYPLRFTLVPLVLWGALVTLEWVAVAAMVLATFWDVWHSGAQTFGFGRIYDRNDGFPVELGRRLDFWLNQLLYAGPILAGATLLDHVDSFADFNAFDDAFDAFLVRIPAYAGGHSAWLTWIVLGAGSAFLAYYVYRYVQFARSGHRTSPLKVYLLVSTGLCSIYTWGLNSWGEAFFIMNLFHAAQYVALVWAVEHKRMVKSLGLAKRRHGKTMALALYLGSIGLYGCMVELLDPSLTVAWSVTMVVSLMHFWYDAFIWSVRKQQI